MTAQGNGLLHPDEDLLAAFAERSLLPPEREQVLAHLAACRRCRDIVFLAHEATPELPAGFLKETVPPEPRGARLRLLWVLALTAIVVVITVAGFELRRTQQRNQAQMASTNGSATKQPEPQPAMSKPGPPSRAGQRAATSASRIEQRGIEQQGIELKHRHERPAHRSRPIPDASGDEVVADTLSVVTASPVVAAPPVAAASPVVAAPPVAAAPPEVAAQAKAQAAAQAKMRPSIAAQRPAFGIAAYMQQATAGALPSAPVFRIQDSSISRCIGNNCLPRPLPGSAKPVSVASSFATVLAVDTDGNLFSSEDAGDNWKRVDSQWQGKAISIELKAEGAAKKVPPPNGPIRDVFTLTNEQGQTWTSEDRGKTWQPD